MAIIMKRTSVAGALVVTMVVACGGGGKNPQPPTSVASASPSATESSAPAASSAAPAASASAAPAASSAAPATPAAKGTFHKFEHAANSMKVDKIGTKDGAFKADGIKDAVFDVDYEGPATALLVASSDSSGTPTGEVNADTLVANQQLPPDVAANLNLGKDTAGIAVYEGDELLNAKDGSLNLPDGRHKITVYVSIKKLPKNASYVAIALLPDNTIVKSNVATAK